MIKKLSISNFQSHKNTEIELHPGVNTILGPSDSGKTAIIRALRWAVWNRPLGDAFRSHWGGDTSVVLKTDDCAVERFKGKEDYYKLWADDGLEPLEFKAFGTKPPEEIAQALNLSEQNLQSQHDNAFLISNNPGEVARHFNKVANIDKIDSSLKAVESWVRKLRQDVQSTEDEIARHQEQLAEFEYLDKLEADIEVLESLESKKEKTGSDIQKLTRLLNEITEVGEKIQQAGVLVPAEKEVNSLLELYKSKAEKVEQYKDLKELAIQIYETENQITDYREILADEKQINAVLDLYNELKEVEQGVSSLESLNTQIWKTQNDIKHKQDQLTKLEKSWHDNMPEICPLCGR